MAKCIRCGKSTLVRGHVSLKDGAICTPCFRELGYKISDAAVSRLYTYAELTKSETPTPSVQFAHYGENRPVNETDQEREIYDIIRSLLDDYNLESDVLCLVRKSDSYVSACMESSGDYGQMDLARFKFTDRAKWIKICPEFNKVIITCPDDVTKYAEELCAAYRFNEPYL